MGREWSREELEFLERYRGVFTVDDYCKKLKRSKASVANKLSKLRRNKTLIY